MAAACRANVLEISSRPLDVSSTRRTRRSSVVCRFTSLFFSRRSTATLIDPGVSQTLGPIVLTGNGPLLSSTSSTRKSESRSEEHTSELQSQFHLVCRLLLEKKKNTIKNNTNIKLI